MRPRVLVVDDEPGMLHAVRRILERHCDLVCAASAEQALSNLEDVEPDVAILDIRMPGIDGFELMERLKQRYPDADVILMTGSVGDTDQKLVRAIRGGAFYFIRKPFDREVLRTLLDRCLELRRLAGENRRHVRRLENVLTEARAFQHGLIPSASARFGRVAVDARWVPCEDLCGDFYDYGSNDGETVAFLIADVAGHGAPAAMLTGVVKFAFESCHREGYEPCAVVERIAAGIRTFRDNRFVSLFCGRINLDKGHLDYVNAGHPPGLLWGREGGPTSLGPTGPIVSPVFDTATWSQERVPFGSGGRMLLYTDGVTEARGGSEFYGDERLGEVVAAVPAGGKPLLDVVTREVEAFMQGRRPDDDITLMTIGIDD